MTSATPNRFVAERSLGSRGFTLIELLVVLALMGVLAGMIVPRFSGTVRSVEAEEAARTLRSHLERWRVDAARHARRIEVQIAQGASAEFTVDRFDPALHPAWDFAPIELAETRAGLRRSTLRVDFEGTLEADPPTITFFPDGSSTEAIIRLRDARGRAFLFTLRPYGLTLERESGASS